MGMCGLLPSLELVGVGRAISHTHTPGTCIEEGMQRELLFGAWLQLSGFRCLGAPRCFQHCFLCPTSPAKPEGDLAGLGTGGHILNTFQVPSSGAKLSGAPWGQLLYLGQMWLPNQTQSPGSQRGAILFLLVLSPILPLPWALLSLKSA